MVTIPQTIEEAVEQAKEATKIALAEGFGRIQVELAVPEIALQAQAIAFSFASIFADYGSGLKILFPDTGAAALARRDWGEIPFKVSDLGSSRTPVEMKINDEDQIFVVVCPSAVEVNQVEKLCNLAGDRPVVLLLPQLEDVSIVGIGYAARQLRERFLSTLDWSYYFRPLEGAAVLRVFPSPWQVFRETEDGYELIAEESQKPLGEVLDRILNPPASPESPEANSSKKTNLLGSLQQFLKALSQ